MQLGEVTDVPAALDITGHDQPGPAQRLAVLGDRDQDILVGEVDHASTVGRNPDYGTGHPTE